MGSASQRGDALHSTAPPPPCALHTLIRCATPEDLTPESRARAARRTRTRVVPWLVCRQAGTRV
jgi:hypothetical protein